MKYKSKPTMSQEISIKEVKSLARIDTYCSSHTNCFRYSRTETPGHVKKKFERYFFWREVGCIVFTELILKTGDKPDLIIIKPDGQILIEEIIQSEKEKSIVSKMGKYPYKIEVIKVG